MLSVPLLVGIVATFPATPAQARTAPRPIVALASSTVLAVEGPSEVRTGFAFGTPTTALASVPGGVDVHLVDAHGKTASFNVARREDEFVVARVSSLERTPLRASPLRRISAGTAAYVLGPPLGYEAGRLRFVRLPPIDLATTRRAVIEGALPRAFRGAPVVTEGGRLIGAVATVGHGRWTLEPSARLARLVANAGSGSAEGGLPILVVIACALAIVLLVGGLMVTRVRRRQRHAFEAPRQGPRPAAIDRPTASEPLVRLRDAERVSSEDDFEVLIKSREGS
jgi:hypothetical protein